MANTLTHLPAPERPHDSYDNGVMGGIIDTPAFKATFGNPSPDTLGNIVSLYELGCFAGAMSTFLIGGYLGRRLSIIFGAGWMIVGAVIQAASSSVGVMILGRIVSGVGMGIINSTVPIMQAEMSPAISRGKLVAVDLTLLNVGIVTSYWVDYGFNFSSVRGNATWRVPVALQCVFIVGIALVALVVPDTPRWYATRGRNDEALTVLARLRGRSEEDEGVRAEYGDILQAIEHETAAKRTGWLSLLKPLGAGGWGDDALKSRRRLLLACFIQAAQQLGGINALIYYSSTLFSQSLGMDSHDSAILAGGLNMVLILGSTISIFTVDTVGRRRLLMPCISGMSLVFVLQTIFVHKIQNNTAGGGVKNAAVAMLFLFEFFFSVGFQATVWMIPSEVLPLNVRTQGSALSTASNWICNFIVVKFTPSALANIGYRTYIIFAIFNAAWVPVIYFFLPETKGKVLEEIDELFATDGWHLEHQARALEAGGGAKAGAEADKKEVSPTAPAAGATLPNVPELGAESDEDEDLKKGGGPGDTKVETSAA